MAIDSLEATVEVVDTIPRRRRKESALLRRTELAIAFVLAVGVGLVGEASSAPGEPPPGRRGVPATPDVSQCDNCDDFPREFLEVDPAELLDLASLPPERRLDFLIGEWELIFPAVIPEQDVLYTVDQPVGFEIVEWFVPNRVLQAFQEWPFTSKGRPPFRAKTDLRYDKDARRWQMLWMTGSSSSLFVGGLEDGAIALYEHEFAGEGRRVELVPAMRYVFSNITRNTFIAEEYQSSDGGRTHDILKWQLLYRRRVPSEN